MDGLLISDRYQGEFGGPRTPSYAAAKMGVMALTHCLARFLGHRNICGKLSFPGVIAGEFTEETMSPDVRETALSLMLLKRFARYEEMVGGRSISCFLMNQVI